MSVKPRVLSLLGLRYPFRTSKGHSVRSYNWFGFAVVESLVACGGLTACADEPICGGFPLDAAERACVVEQISKKVRRHWVFADLKRVDLDVFTTQVESLAESELDDNAFLLELQSVVSALHDGHTRLNWPGAPWRASYARLRLRRVGDSILVATRVPGVKIDLGEAILEIDGRSVGDLLEETAQYVSASTEATRDGMSLDRLLVGRSGQMVQVETDGGTRSLAYAYPVPLGFGNDPPTMKRIGEFGYIRIQTFGEWFDDIDTFDRAINDLMGTRGLVIDLRRNSGGSVVIARSMLGRLLDSRYAPARGATYGGELALLIDCHTYSAANHFVYIVTRFGRATLVGENTGGGSGLSEEWSLLDDLTLRVSNDVLDVPGLFDAEEGISPNINVTFTREEIAAGLDSEWGNPAKDKTLATALVNMGWVE